MSVTLPSANSLPFQPINARQESMNADTLYQQKLNERSFIDIPTAQMPPGQQPTQMAAAQNPFSQSSHSTQSMQLMQQSIQQSAQAVPSGLAPPSAHATVPPIPPMPQMPSQPVQPMQMPQSMQMPQPPSAPHPSVLAMFLTLTPDAQQRFSIANPVAYAQLCAAAQQHFQMQSLQQAAQMPSVGSHAVAGAGAVASVAPPKPAEEKQKKKRSKREKIVKPVYSESDNFHSSDEELNVKPVTFTQPQKTTGTDTDTGTGTSSGAHKHHVRLPLDFRNNLCEITDNGYSLRWPRQYRSVRSIELVDCTINRSPVLDKEPYIYMSILEIPGDFILTGGTESVFGKLIPEKTVNEFIFYKPENCRKSFTKPVNLDKLTISFLQYDQTDISLSKLDIRNLSQSSGGGYYKLNTRGSHYLTTGDLVSITYKQPNRTTVETLAVLDTPSPDTLILEVPIKELKTEDRCSFEKVQLKCSLTFKIQCA